MTNRLSALIERARSHKPITALTLIGVLLLPAILGGVLVAALQDPTQRLDSMTAAVVNDDEPVTVELLMKENRDALNAAAGQLGIPEPEKLANKREVAEAILAEIAERDSE